jgi:hypothetical protein
MPLVPLTIPPGVARNGTDYQSQGRWRDASLVRWTDGTMRPVGGWASFADTSTPVPRSCLAWRDLSGDRWIAVAGYNQLEVVSASAVVYDITPAGLVAGIESAAASSGFGAGFYGVGYYGTPRSSAVISEATTWSLDMWGEYLIACSTADGRIFEWQLATGTPAAVVANAPVNNLATMVTAERFLFALGAGGNPRLVQWCDREDNTDWTPSAINEAGDLELQTSGQIMCGVRVRGQALILTDQDAHAATYQGPPFVYGFEAVGASCGIISRQAVAVVDAGAFWMGAAGFFAYRGGVVEALPCEVVDYIFSGMNRAQSSKVASFTVRKYSEIWWLYPSETSLECDRYVTFNYKEGHWAIGTIDRTCGVDSGVFVDPLMIAPDGVVYRHETGLNYAGASVYAETGPMSIGSGDQVMSVTGLVPDERTQGDVTATFLTRFNPQGAERSYGPYAMATPTSVRFTGRQVRMRVTGARLADWRVGIMRLDAVPGGRR